MKNLKMKSARAAKDLSQQELADLCGVTRQTINAIEKGNYNPTINSVYPFATDTIVDATPCSGW